MLGIFPLEPSLMLSLLQPYRQYSEYSLTYIHMIYLVTCYITMYMYVLRSSTLFLGNV